MSTIFKRGYEASREEKERQDEEREKSGKKLWRFFLTKDGDEADLRFLTEEPINFHEHTIKGSKNGKETYQTYTCSGDNCPFCEDGDRPTYKGAYLVVDRREYEYTDSKGKKQTGKNQVRLFVQGMKVVSQLDRISDKYGLSNRDVTLVRLGKGTQTTYTVERGEEDKLTEKEITALLPEKLREEYDGTMESLYAIVEEQLLMNIDKKGIDKEDTSNDNEDDEESEAIISIDDDEPEKKKVLPKKKSMFKKPQNSLKKNSAKSLLQRKKKS